MIYLGGGDQFGLAGLKSREEYEERIIELHCVIAELTRYSIFATKISEFTS